MDFIIYASALGLILSAYQYSYLRTVFKKGKLTIPFLNKAMNTIKQYPDTYLPSHQLSIELLENRILPKIQTFIKWERQFTQVNGLVLVLNLWILLGVLANFIDSLFLFYFISGLVSAINIDLIVQQFKLYSGARYCKRACKQYQSYMEQREHAKESIDEFLDKIDSMIETFPIEEDDNNNNKKNEEPPDGRSN